MQEFHQSVPGVAAGRLFGGAGASSDLRRPHHHQQQGGPAGARCSRGVSAAPEAIKCPRCESTNTKFCYYNNYNLAQPRHFCKSCRRYWTKGGVLRNVPVGGGCRKAKRSSPSAPASAEAKNPRRASASSPRSATDDSGSTSPTAAAAVITGHTNVSNPFSSSSTTSVDVAPPAPIFADQAAALASLFAPPPPPPPPPLPVFSFTTTAQPKEEGASSSSSSSVVVVAGHAVPQDEPSAADMAPFTSLDAAIFEQLGDASAAAAYWNAGSCWTDVQDPSVYLP